MKEKSEETKIDTIAWSYRSVGLRTLLSGIAYSCGRAVYHLGC